MRCGKRVCFHGAFKSKAAAKRKERKVGGFIRRFTDFQGKTRYGVMTGKK